MTPCMFCCVPEAALQHAAEPWGLRLHIATLSNRVSYPLAQCEEHDCIMHHVRLGADQQHLQCFV
jgi:hypothetical protein